MVDRVRFAPSPTGKLHLGSARTALFNWLFARSAGGSLVLRIEDTDPTRSLTEYEEDILGSLAWMGINWDEGPDIGGPNGPYRQSQRWDTYRELAERLVSEGKAYPCYCSLEELERMKEEDLRAGRPPRYHGRCRELTTRERSDLEASGISPSVRFKVPEGEIAWDDIIHGRVKIESSEIGDFIIVRSDGRAGFNFAVVADDIDMEITHVIRGEDHLTNTARHLMLFEALGADPPRFAHHSLLMGKDGSKMSKRHGATAVSEYVDAGYLPGALVNYLVLLSWSPGDDREVFSLEELIEYFSLEGMSRSPAIFDKDKLTWLNRQHLKRLADSELAEKLMPFLPERMREEVSSLAPGRLQLAVQSFRESLDTLVDAPGHLGIYLKEGGDLSPEAEKAFSGSSGNMFALDNLAALIGREEELGLKESKECIRRLGEMAVENGYKKKEVLMPLRAALSGETRGPGLPYLISVLGKEECLRRIEIAKERVK